MWYISYATHVTISKYWLHAHAPYLHGSAVHGCWPCCAAECLPLAATYSNMIPRQAPQQVPVRHLATAPYTRWTTGLYHSAACSKSLRLQMQGTTTSKLAAAAKLMTMMRYVCYMNTLCLQLFHILAADWLCRWPVLALSSTLNCMEGPGADKDVTCKKHTPTRCCKAHHHNGSWMKTQNIKCVIRPYP